MNNIPFEIKNYISKRTSKKWKLSPELNEKFGIIVVIPVLAESDNLKVLLQSLKNCTLPDIKVLIIFVINNVENSSDEIINDNKAAYKYLQIEIDKNEIDNLKFAVVDAYSTGFSTDKKNGGVGLARKIGMDIALNYFDYTICGNNALVCLDADCTVSSNYLSQIKTQFVDNNYGAAYMNYQHPFPEDKESLKAIICYEIFLRYYLLGLFYAESKFAVQTIGSTMICSPKAYVKIGGMNKRKAAEDFYFMEALAKNYKTHSIKNSFVFPSSRGSWRVPFGTGQRVNRFLQKSQNEYLLYSISSFKILREWNIFFMNESNTSVKDILINAKHINKHLYDFLVINNFAEDWKNIVSNSKGIDQINKQKVFWFDGFRTLKLIHYLRDNGFPQQQMFDAVDELFGLLNSPFHVERRSTKIPGINKQIDYLNILRNLTNSLT